MSYRYPYGNTEQMNLDWFLKQWETFRADWAEAQEDIDGSLDAEIAKVEAAMSELYAARDAAAASATAARQSSLDAAAAQVAAGNSKTAAQAAETAARGSQQAAAESAQEAHASANGAENSALTATQAANTATQQAAGADAAKGAAEAAQQAAEAAQAAAAQSAGQAGQAATAAGDHADDAADSATLAQQAAQDMSDSVAQITTNKNDISDLKESVSNTDKLPYDLTSYVYQHYFFGKRYNEQVLPNNSEAVVDMNIITFGNTSSTTSTYYSKEIFHGNNGWSANFEPGVGSSLWQDPAIFKNIPMKLVFEFFKRTSGTQAPQIIIYYRAENAVTSTVISANSNTGYGVSSDNINPPENCDGICILCRNRRRDWSPGIYIVTFELQGNSANTNQSLALALENT